MENDIWNEISSFLNQLRCENINRESYIYFQELANIQLKKKMEKEKVNKLLDHISYEDREKLKQPCWFMGVTHIMATLTVRKC